MLTNKTFWIGFLVAYGLAVFVPPTRFLKRKG
jgi:hypothetical protein